MNKPLMGAGLALVVVGGVYLGGVYFSGQQADQYMQRYIQMAQQKSQGQAQLDTRAERGFFNSTYHITYRIDNADFNEDVEALLGSRDIPLKVEVAHGFLSASSVTTLDQGPLLTKVKSAQANPDEQPFTLRAEQDFGIFSQRLSGEGELTSDRFVIPLDEGNAELTISAIEAEFEQDGREFELDFRLPELRVNGKHGEQFVLTNLTVIEEGELDNEDPFQAVMAEELDATLKIESISLSTPDHNLMSVQALSIQTAQSLDDDRVQVFINTDADQLVFQESDKPARLLKSPTLNIQINMDYQAARALTEQLQQMNSSNQQAVFEQMDGLIAKVDGITQKGVTLVIDELSGEYNGAKAEAKADLQLAPFRASELMAQPMQLLQYTTLDASVQIPQTVVTDLPADLQANLKQMAQMQYLQATTDGGYEGALQINDGKVVLNGQPM